MVDSTMTTVRNRNRPLGVRGNVAPLCAVMAPDLTPAELAHTICAKKASRWWALAYMRFIWEHMRRLIIFQISNWPWSNLSLSDHGTGQLDPLCSRLFITFELKPLKTDFFGNSSRWNTNWLGRSGIAFWIGCTDWLDLSGMASWIRRITVLRRTCEVTWYTRTELAPIRGCFLLERTTSAYDLAACLSFFLLTTVVYSASISCSHLRDSSSDLGPPSLQRWKKILNWSHS